MGLPKFSLSQAKASVSHAFSSWENFKQATQVRDTLDADQYYYVNADPAWMNEGKSPLFNISMREAVS